MKKWQLVLGTFLFFLIEQLLVAYSFGIKGGWQLGLVTVLNLTLVGLVIYLAGRFNLWKPQKPVLWSGKGLKIIALWSVYLFLAKMLSGIVLALQAGPDATTFNQELIEGSDLNSIVLFLTTVLVAPFVEEFIFRGLIMGKISSAQSALGLIISSLLFALIHLPTDLGSWLLYGSMGLVLGLLYRKTQRLDYCISVHFLNNLLAFFMMLLVV